MNYLRMPVNSNQNSVYSPSLQSMQACMNPFACKLKVEGKGIITVQPDMAVVILGVTTENKELKRAQEENAAKINEVLRALKEIGITSEDIQTQSYTIDPQYDYIEGKQVFRGYRVLHNLKIIVKNISQVGQVVDTAVSKGANQVNNIRFSLSNPAVYYQKALKAAIENALTKAHSIGDELGIILSKVPSQITEQSTQPDGPITPVMYQAADTSTEIQSGQIEVVARIEAIFTYIRD